MRALAPPAPGNFCASRSWACWDSVPGTENLLLVWPLNATALATTRPRTVSHASSTVLRRRKAQPPSRYRYVAISLDSLWLRPRGFSGRSEAWLRGRRSTRVDPSFGPWSGPPSGTRASSTRDETPSLRKTLRRWYSTVLGLTKSCAAASRLLAPPATSWAMRSSCGVRSSMVEASRLRALSPVALSSPRARCAQSSAPTPSKASRAERSCARASSLRRSRRRRSPYASCVRARS